MKKIAVGVLFLYEDPQKRTLKALLSRRSDFDFEKMRPEKYASLCQLSVHGEVNKGETILQALLRETEEEVGPAVRKILSRHIKELHVVSKHSTHDRTITNFAIKLPRPIKNLLKLSRSIAEVLEIEEKDLPDIQIFRKTASPAKRFQKEKIYMFQNDKEAVEKAFRFYSQLL